MTERRPATEQEAATLASTVRLRIIRMARLEPLTNAEIAARLRRDPATTLYHVRRLVDGGFLEPLPPRRGRRGSRERPYRATALSRSLDAAGRQPGVAEAVLGAYLAEVAEVGAAAVEQERLALRLAPDDAAALRAELRAVLDRWADRPVRDDGEAVAVYLAIYPGVVDDPPSVPS